MKKFGDYRDGRQFQGSKKKMRAADYAMRELKRQEKQKEMVKLERPTKSVDNITSG